MSEQAEAQSVESEAKTAKSTRRLGWAGANQCQQRAPTSLLVVADRVQGSCLRPNRAQCANLSDSTHLLNARPLRLLARSPTFDATAIRAPEVSKTTIAITHPQPANAV